MVKLTEQLASHYTPIDSMFAKYKSRLEIGRIKTKDKSRRILKQIYSDGKAKLSLFAASPLLLVEQLFIHLDECIAEVLPC